MNIFHDIDSARIKPEEFIAVIEIAKGSNMKYELDKKTGLLILDRILFTSTHYPASYGFIPRTIAKDKDPLDVLVLCSEPLIPLTEIKCRPIGVISMVDQGMDDDKIIAVAVGDPNYSGYQSIHELPSHIFEEMQHFFKVYKELENKQTSVHEVKDADAAKKIVEDSIQAYKDFYHEQ
ncbi:MAG: inorganic diphosphatase [Bacilli bacterium]|jgi:inorganic pyrophosphatase|nr:inorganic diphosphatase [Bacilli bacterium]